MKKIALPFFITAAIVVITFLLFNDMESFFSNLLNSVSNHPKTYAGISFLILTSDIVLPVPSSIVMYINGYVLGVICGSTISFISLLVGATIGYYLGKLTSFGMKAKSDANSNNILFKYGALAILMSRGIPIISESICVVCGYNKMPFKQYLIYNLIGYIPLCLLYAFCGSVGYDKNTFFISFGFSLLISAAFWFFGRTFFLKSKNVKVD